eukprot:5086390-Pyramimonas_sp.AAC.1
MRFKRFRCKSYYCELFAVTKLRGREGLASSVRPPSVSLEHTSQWSSQTIENTIPPTELMCIELPIWLLIEWRLLVLGGGFDAWARNMQPTPSASASWGYTGQPMLLNHSFTVIHLRRSGLHTRPAPDVRVWRGPSELDQHIFFTDCPRSQQQPGLF